MLSSRNGLFRTVCIVAALFAMTSCACRTKRVETANVPMAEAGSVLRDINFAFDSYEIDGVARQILAKNADWLKANGSVKVEVEGHCDERGTNEYNMALGERRATAAVDYLRSLGISASRLSPVSFGEELPLDPASNEAAWAKNRRVHFAIVK